MSSLAFGLKTGLLTDTVSSLPALHTSSDHPMDPQQRISPHARHHHLLLTCPSLLLGSAVA